MIIALKIHASFKHHSNTIYYVQLTCIEKQDKLLNVYWHGRNSHLHGEDQQTSEPREREKEPQFSSTAVSAATQIMNLRNKRLTQNDSYLLFRTYIFWE